MSGVDWGMENYKRGSHTVLQISLWYGLRSIATKYVAGMWPTMPRASTRNSSSARDGHSCRVHQPGSRAYVALHPAELDPAELVDGTCSAIPWRGAVPTSCWRSLLACASGTGISTCRHGTTGLLSNVRGRLVDQMQYPPSPPKPWLVPP